MAEHAKFFQASSAARWMPCPGSVKMCDGIEDESSRYAEEGTEAHELAAHILSSFEADVSRWDVDMVDNVLRYTNEVWAVAGAHQALLVEQRVDFSHVLEQPDCFGTADCIVLAGDEIQIHDLKYGMGVKVDAEENPQLMLYALGALRDYDMIAEFKTARLFIHQVRLGHVSEWRVSVEDLKAFGEAARLAAAVAMSENPPLVPGEKQCKFCRAKAHCPALAAHVEEIVGSKFDNLDAEEIEQGPERMGTNYLAHCMSAVSLVEDWCKGVRARVERELLAGNAIDGWKLVQGRKGARKWTSEKDAEETLRKMKLKVEEMYDFKVISPTTAEKLAKAKTIGPRQWPALQALITQSEGGLSVAPASDARPAATLVASAEDFADLT
jgi:hypothetical protein